MGSTKPIKAFIKMRTPSVREQVAGATKGEILEPFGFPGGGRPGGPGRFGPGNFLVDSMVDALDKNQDKSVSRDEFIGGFTKWFHDWNSDKSGFLTEEQLRSGINRDLAPSRGGPPGGGGPGFGPPPARGDAE